MAELILLNKPVNVLCQFTDDRGRQTLADFVPTEGVYPAGRLDFDSEGLVLLTADGQLQHRIASPAAKLGKTYWAQVEGIPGKDALRALQQGVTLKDGLTAPAQCRQIQPPGLWPRDPPVRFRADIPTTWIELILTEGRNRQVRRMTAAVGHPTLRLIRVAVGPWKLGALAPGECTREQVHLPEVKARPARGPSGPRLASSGTRSAASRNAQAGEGLPKRNPGFRRQPKVSHRKDP